MGKIIAVPSAQPGGLDAKVGAHFGHCALFTLVTVSDEQIEEIRIIPNKPHQNGGCMAPIQILAQEGVKSMIARGMGAKPLMGFVRAGIEVYFSNGSKTVGEAIKAALAGELERFGQNQICGGGGHCHGHQSRYNDQLSDTQYQRVRNSKPQKNRFC